MFVRHNHSLLTAFHYLGNIAYLNVGTLLMLPILLFAALQTTAGGEANKALVTISVLMLLDQLNMKFMIK